MFGVPCPCKCPSARARLGLCARDSRTLLGGVSPADLFRSGATLFGSLSGLGAIFERGLEMPSVISIRVAGSGQRDHAGSFRRCLPERFDRYQSRLREFVPYSLSSSIALPTSSRASAHIRPSVLTEHPIALAAASRSSPRYHTIRKTSRRSPGKLSIAA